MEELRRTASGRRLAGHLKEATYFITAIMADKTLMYPRLLPLLLGGRCSCLQDREQSTTHSSTTSVRLRPATDITPSTTKSRWLHRHNHHKSLSRRRVHGLLNGVKQSEYVIKSGHFDRADHGPGVIDRDPQWLAASLRGLGDLDEGLQTVRG